MPAHYQSKVRKNTAESPPSPRPAAGPQVVNNLIGPNTRVNIQSSDSSTNVVSVESAVLFDNLREAIQIFSLDSTLARQLIQNVNAMQSAVGTKTFGERYKEFIAVAADHMTRRAVPPGVETTAAVNSEALTYIKDMPKSVLAILR